MSSHVKSSRTAKQDRASKNVVIDLALVRTYVAPGTSTSRMSHVWRPDSPIVQAIRTTVIL